MADNNQREFHLSLLEIAFAGWRGFYARALEAEGTATMEEATALFDSSPEAQRIRDVLNER